jgi:hypothetical protein
MGSSPIRSTITTLRRLNQVMAKMTREQIDKELYFVERVLGDIRNVEIPKLVYDEEKEVVKKALLEYKSQLQDALYR